MLNELLFPRIKPADISILSGKVMNLKHITHIRGGNESIDTSYISTFEIDSQPIMLACSEPILIDIDDEIAVAGYIKQGIFKSSAYYNFRKKIYSVNRIDGIIFCLIAVMFFVLTASAVISCDPFFIFISSFFAFAGYHLYRAGRADLQKTNLIIKKFSDFQSHS
jgi:hypothetical protein